jgi:hypothetical protein
MSDNDEARGRAGQARGVTEDDILGDLQSKYTDVRCPVHGVPPKFEVDQAGGIIEGFCCETLGQIFRELRAGEGKAAHR